MNYLQRGYVLVCVWGRMFGEKYRVQGVTLVFGHSLCDGL